MLTRSRIFKCRKRITSLTDSLAKQIRTQEHKVNYLTCWDRAFAALVFPAEAILAPDIGPAFAAGGFGDSALKREPVAPGVGGDGVGDVEEAAEVVEMGLGGGALFEVHRAPFVDEILGGHGVPLPALCS
jgi:hypothetical protein